MVLLLPAVSPLILFRYFTSCVRSSKKYTNKETKNIKKSEIILVTKALFWFIHKNCIRDDSNQFSFTSQSSSFIIHTECFLQHYDLFFQNIRNEIIKQQQQLK